MATGVESNNKEPASYNWCAFGFGLLGTGMRLGADIVQIGMNQIATAAKNVGAMGGIAQSIANQQSLESQAKDFRIQADDALRAAGRAQEQGRQAKEHRLVVLGQQKGNVVAAAAGSGIEVSSSVVSKVLKDTVKSAYNDTETISKNEREAAQQKINEMTALRINADRAEANAEMEGINQKLMWEQIKLNNKAAKHAMIGGILGAAGNLFSGIGGAVAMGAMANNPTGNRVS